MITVGTHTTAIRDIENAAEELGGTIPGLLAHTANESSAVPGLVAVGADPRVLSWAEVERAAVAKADELRSAGVRVGDRVATAVPTGVELAVTMLAILRAGAVAAPLATGLDRETMVALLEHSGATVLVSDRASRDELPHGVSVLDSGIPAAAPPLSPPSSGRAGDDLAVLAYFAGVDGPPRAAMYTHRALLANAVQLRRCLAVGGSGRHRVLLAAPLAHLYGIVSGLLTPMLAGWSVLLPSRNGDGATLEGVLAAGRAGRATMLVGTPATYTELSGLGAQRLDEPLAGVSRMLCGPSPAHPRVSAAMRRATGLGLVQCYGRAEVAGVLTSTLGLAPGEAQDFGTVGRPLPGTEITLVDSGGGQELTLLDPADPADVFTDEASTGLLEVRGPASSAGYWPDGEFGPDADGWSRTGDVGYFDAHGGLHLADRAADVLVVRGFTVYPHEVEDVIAELAQVADVAVVGARDDDGVTTVGAVVVPTVGATVTAAEVLAHCAQELPAYKVPATVRFVAELPHTPTGLLRRNRVGM